MTPFPDPHAPLDDLRDLLAQMAALQPLWSLRGDLGGFIRADGSAWGESLGATHCQDFELAWVQEALAPGGLEPIDPQSAQIRDEASFWPKLPSLLAWMQGSIHPDLATDGLAYPLRRTSISPCMNHRRIRIGRHDLTIPHSDYERMLGDSTLRHEALENPSRLEARARLDMSKRWHETEFASPIAFHQSSLPAIAAGSPILARRLDAGSWLFEHPDEPSWLCKLPAPGLSPTVSRFAHDGLDIHEFSDPSGHEPPWNDD